MHDPELPTDVEYVMWAFLKHSIERKNDKTLLTIFILRYVGVRAMVIVDVDANITSDHEADTCFNYFHTL